jgi:hypothetical protein
MANGKIVYYTDGVTPTEYTFDINYRYGWRPGFIDLVSRKRALDGTVYTDKGPVIRTYQLDFRGAPPAQKEAFEAAYNSGFPILFYPDSGAAEYLEMIFDSPPDIKSEAGFRSGIHTWSISIDLSATGET